MFKTRGRLLYFLFAGCILAAGLPSTVWAATKKNETRSPIDMVYLNVTSYIEDGDETGHIEVSTDSQQYSIGSTDWGTVPTDGWTVGDQPKVKIDLHARSGNYFNKTTGAKKIIINGAEYASAKRSDNDETLIVTIKLPPVKGELDDPETVEWVGYPLGKASWSKVDSANAYELKLYRDDQVVYSVEKTSATTYDFYPYMTQAGTYKFRVRAIPVSTEEQTYITPGDWVYSEETDIDDSDTLDVRYNDKESTKPVNPSQVGWVENRDGWRYRNTDGTYVSNSWKQINGKWYLFGYDGYMLRGWQKSGGNTYYLSDNGELLIRWQQINRFWYYMNPADGRVLTGWIYVDGRWYYMNPNDATMTTGWALIDGKWYYLNPNEGGAMAVNTTVGGYQINGDGVWVQ